MNEPTSRPSQPGGPRPPLIEKQDIYLSQVSTYEDQRKFGFRPRNDCAPWPLRLPLDWGADPFMDRNWRSKLQHWRMTDPILVEYFRNGNPDVLREAFNYAIDWHRFHIQENRVSDFSWKDAVTGIRALRIAFFLDRILAGELHASAREMKALDDLIESHAKKLQDSRFISRTNHGLFQVFGLNLLCKVAVNHPACQNGEAFAAEQFKTILHSQFDKNGVHREHSPAYHFFASRVVASLGGTRHFAIPEAERLLAAADKIAPWLVFPDMQVARIGDSGGTRRKLQSVQGPVVSLLDGRKFLVGDFCRSGYAVVRSAQASGQSMIFVTGMANGNTHKHADDLSFELYEFGQKILIDSGKYSYQNDNMRTYVRSAAAHNTISLLDHPIGPSDLRIESSRLKNVATDGTVFTITGSIQRPELFTQHRNIQYNPGRFIVIADLVEARQERTFVSSLHLAPELSPTLTSVGFVVRLPSRQLLRARQLVRMPIDAVRGQDNPLLGWSTESYGRMTPTTTIRAICKGKTAVVVWVMWFEHRWRDDAMKYAKITRKRLLKRAKA